MSPRVDIIYPDVVIRDDVKVVMAKQVVAPNWCQIFDIDGGMALIETIRKRALVTFRRYAFDLGDLQI